jgi:hypothetical protein
MAPKIFRRLTGPLSSGVGLVSNTGSGLLNASKKVVNVLGKGTRRVINTVGSKTNNAVGKFISKGGSQTRKVRKMRKGKMMKLFK